jgi:hypothetical protein
MIEIKTKREKAIAAAAVLIGALFLGDRFILSPIAESLRSLDERVIVQSSRLRRGRLLLARKEALRKEYGALTRAGGAGGGSDALDPTTLIKEVENQARAAGARIKDLRPSTTDKKTPALSIVVESSWDAVARLIQGLEHSPRMIRIEKALIQSRSDSGAVSAQLLVLHPSAQPDDK